MNDAQPPAKQGQILAAGLLFILDIGAWTA